MRSVAAADVKRLRDETGAGMLDAKKALEEAGGDAERAKELLRMKGLATAEKKAGRATGEGIVAAYIHHGGKVGVLVEVRCETDFVARTEEFRNLGRHLAMQIAVGRPRWVSREEVPEEVVEKEKEMIAGEMEKAVAGKPPQVVEKILAGKLDRFYGANCLLEQEFLIAPAAGTEAKTVQDYLSEVVAKVGENITIGRFSRIEVGE